MYHAERFSALHASRQLSRTRRRRRRGARRRGWRQGRKNRGRRGRSRPFNPPKGIVKRAVIRLNGAATALTSAPGNAPSATAEARTVGLDDHRERAIDFARFSVNLYLKGAQLAPFRWMH